MLIKMNKLFIISGFVLCVILIFGCKEKQAAVEGKEQTYRFVIVGHFMSLFELAVWPRQIKSGEHDPKTLGFPEKWFSRANMKKYMDPEYKNNLLVLPEYRLQRFVDQVNKCDADAVFLLGDNAINHNEAEWKVINKYRNKTKAPWYFVAGNHDMLGTNARGEYMKNVGYLNKNITIGNNQFMLMRPIGQKQDEINLSQECILQIKEGLKEHVEHRFIMMHHRLYERRNGNWNREVMPLILGKVHHVFYGNFQEEFFRVFHILEWKIQHVSTCIWNRHSGKTLWRLKDGVRRDHFVLLTVEGENVYYQPVSINGTKWM